MDSTVRLGGPRPLAMMLTKANRHVDIPVEGKGREVHHNVCTAFGVTTEEKRGTVIVNRIQWSKAIVLDFRTFATLQRRRETMGWSRLVVSYDVCTLKA